MYNLILQYTSITRFSYGNYLHDILSETPVWTSPVCVHKTLHSKVPSVKNDGSWYLKIKISDMTCFEVWLNWLPPYVQNDVRLEGKKRKMYVRHVMNSL
jgi:hypothetical protein